MANQQRIKLLVLVGPTAVGKTALSCSLAQRLKGEIVSADSMQVYRGMDIGTAKATKAEQAVVPHHLLDVVSPQDEFNVADYLHLAEQIIKRLDNEGKVPIITGGTGLYVHALVDGFLFPHQGADPGLRKALQEQASSDREGLFQRLKEIDPQAASKLHPNDTRRVVRALEIYYSTGEPISKLQKKAHEEDKPYNPLMIGLTRPREQLYRRIDARVDTMIKGGLIAEVKELLAKYPHQPTALQALGYKEMAWYLNKLVTLEEATYLLKRDSRRYAKRQLSWFRRDERIHWFDVSQQPLEEIMQDIENMWKQHLSSSE